MADAVARAGPLARTDRRARRYAPGSDVGLALGVVVLLSVLILPLPTLLLDLGLALSITAAVLVLMVALFLNRPLDFSSFPTLLLLTTLLRLSLNVAVTRLILSHGNEGPLAAGHVVAAFGGFLMGGDVVIGLIIFSILLVVNFMVITKGSGRIAEVAARFSLDAMPGKQMAIDADLSAGLIDEKEARRRRRELEEESGFYGAMDGAAKFVRGDAIAALIITVINILGGLRSGCCGTACVRRRRRHLHHADRRRRPGVADPRAAGLHRRRHRGDQGRHGGHRRCRAGPPARQQSEASRHGSRRRRRSWRCCPACPTLPFIALAGLAGGGAWLRHKHPPVAASDTPAAAGRDRAADQRHAADGHDPAGAGLWPAGSGGRRCAAADRADQGPASLDRRRDGLRAAAGAHPGQHAAWRRRLFDPHQGDRGRQRRTAPDHAAGDGPQGRHAPGCRASRRASRPSACRRCGSIRR